MKKKSNISLLKKYSKKSIHQKENLSAKDASQIEAQNNFLELWGKIEFLDDYK